jgi:hypothetical protein
MIKATLQTRNFTFEAYGPTTAHATNALKRGLQAHAKQYGLSPTWADGLEIQTQYFDTCVAYRDGERIKCTA